VYVVCVCVVCVYESVCVCVLHVHILSVDLTQYMQADPTQL
jgi:hypothetical protein